MVGFIFPFQQMVLKFKTTTLIDIVEEHMLLIHKHLRFILTAARLVAAHQE
jgi:hypothetical protein